MNQKQLIIMILGGLIICVGIVGLVAYDVIIPKPSNLSPSPTPPSPTSSDLSPSCSKDSTTSLGDNLLVMENRTQLKQDGINAFCQGNYQTAKIKFGDLRKDRKTKNDPEALIYLNNANIAADKLPYLKIAVSVPIGSNLSVALEMLRGVAQAQDEVNRKDGINGKLLQVEIADDNNDSKAAVEIAREFVSDDRVLAVVGHNSSSVSIAAAAIYEQGGLVMISPTSTAKKLSGFGRYIFRTVPSSSLEATTLADYAIKTAHLTNITICADSKDDASKSVKEEFTSAIESDQGKITRTECDFSNPKFNSERVVSRANSAGADGLLLVPSVDKIGQAVEVARANKSRLPLLSYSVMYTFKTLQLGQENVNGMVLTSPWHPKAFPRNLFPTNAAKLWGGQVSWRTAESYDATQAIIAGLKLLTTREGLREALSSTNLSARGTTGTIQFKNGDRNSDPFLVKIVPDEKTGYTFDLISSPSP